MTYPVSNYLTESQLFDLFLNRPVVHSAAWGETYRYLPYDFIADPGSNSCLGRHWQEFEEQVTSFDSPAGDLERLIDDLEGYLTNLKKVHQDFTDFKRHSTIMTLPEPSENADHDVWVAYEDSVRYIDRINLTPGVAA